MSRLLMDMRDVYTRVSTLEESNQEMYIALYTLYSKVKCGEPVNLEELRKAHVALQNSGKIQ